MRVMVGVLHLHRDEDKHEAPHRPPPRPLVPTHHPQGRGQARGPPSAAATAPCPYAPPPRTRTSTRPPIDRRDRPLSLRTTPKDEDKHEAPHRPPRHPLVPTHHFPTPPGRGQARGPPSTDATAPCPYAPPSSSYP